MHYIHVSDASRLMSVPYQTLMSRVRRKTIASVRLGHSVFIAVEDIIPHVDNENLVYAARSILLSGDETKDGKQRGGLEGALVSQAPVQQSGSRCRKPKGQA